MGYINPIYRSGGMLDYVIRLLGITATLSVAIVIGLNTQTISIFDVSLKSKYHYTLPFTFFVIANAIAVVYGLISLTFCLCFKAAALKCFSYFMTLLVISGFSTTSSVTYI